MRYQSPAATGEIPFLLRASALAVLVAALHAADTDVRLVPQLVIGTAGFEPGVAVEIRGLARPELVLRPEVLLNEDGRLGVGGALLYDVSTGMDLPSRHAVAIGPRVLYHNSDHYGWAADAMATWGYDLAPEQRAWRHSIGALATVGALQDRKHDDTDLGASVGIFYAFGF